MIRRKSQRKYLIKRWREMRRQLLAYTCTGNFEPLHGLRVEMKKVRAFIKFTKAYTRKKRTVAQPEAIRKIFKRAGIIREAGINLQLLKRFNIRHPAFREGETHVFEKEIHRFRAHSVQYDHCIGQAFRYLLGTLHPVRNRRVRHWLMRQLKTIGGIVVAPSMGKLHLARKKIKYLLYIHGLLSSQPALVSKINISYLDQLQDAIGKWHDIAVAITMLDAQGVGGKTAINRMKKERNEASADVHAIGDGFWKKVFMS
ncbi:CHAD domain-containing protein [Chitinophaga sp. GCM10012297]|uniref:CHAD domain-containing protein n=1 Tax=Chitinophaga chungangae TaxID=2821488 RepID=A0ABS3YA86_9BACT|nr:CHAD domain-containing protein [Chitinophaga chungangae]MBO9151597.1 CHAD domain-containing protein [Chitinophaga chungangae]